MATCFISYSWDSSEHKAWVRKLASDLVNNGIHVLLDQWDVAAGDDLAEYMETSIRESDRVLLVCTPSFANKANHSRGGVGYEKTIVTGELFHGNRPRKFVPLLRQGDSDAALPSYLKVRLFIDFRGDPDYESSLEEVVRQVYERPRYRRPEIGQPPAFIHAEPVRAARIDRTDALDNRVFCERCGASPGKSTSCLGWSNHKFKNGTGKEFCERCGVRQGSQSDCKGWTSHKFANGTGHEFCERCGVVPGDPSECKGWTSHSFSVGKGNEFCERCGTRPGSATECPGWTKHQFVSQA